MLRRLSAIFCVILIFSLSGCGTGKTFSAAAFEKIISFSADGTDFVGSFILRENGIMQLEMLQPENISGIVFSLIGDEVVFSLEGVTGKLPEGIVCPAGVLFSAIEDMNSAAFTLPRRGCCSFKAEGREGLYEAVVESESMEILRITSAGYIFNFK